MQPRLFRTLRALGSRKIRHFRITPPEPEAARDGLAAVLIVRNGAPYLREWLGFHLAAGVAHFMVYDDGSTDGTVELLRAPDIAPWVTVVPWRLRGRDGDTERLLSLQLSAYAHAVTTFGGRYLRMAFIDLDEFLVPTTGASLLDAVLAAGDVSNMSLPWHMFGHNGHKTRPEGLVVDAYTRRATTPYSPNSVLMRFKCIVDPCRVTAVGVHSFETSDMGGATANARGEVLPHDRRRSADFFVSDPIQLNHYYLLSEEELEQKIARGPVANAEHEAYARRVREKAREIEAGAVIDTRASDFFKAAPARYRSIALGELPSPRLVV